MLNMDYTDTRNGKKVGPTLLHVAGTNRPYVVELEDYEEVIAATADDMDDTVVLTPAASSTEEDMGLDELIAKLKNDHNIDLADLQARAESAGNTDGAGLSAALSAALEKTGTLKLSNGEELSPDVVVSAVLELAETNASLSTRLEAVEKSNEDLALTNATAEVEKLIHDGYILPSKKDKMVELKLSNEELFNDLLPEQPIIDLSGEEFGKVVPKTSNEVDIDAEVARYSKQLDAMGVNTK